MLRPPPLLTCMADPAIPENRDDGRPDPREAAAYIARLWQAGDDCRSKLGRVRDWWAEAGQE